MLSMTVRPAHNDAICPQSQCCCNQVLLHGGTARYWHGCRHPEKVGRFDQRVLTNIALQPEPLQAGLTVISYAGPGAVWRAAAEQVLSPGCIPQAADAEAVQRRLRQQAAVLRAIKSGVIPFLMFMCVCVYDIKYHIYIHMCCVHVYMKFGFSLVAILAMS